MYRKKYYHYLVHSLGIHLLIIFHGYQLPQVRPWPTKDLRFVITAVVFLEAKWKQSNHIFRLLFKCGVSPCSATLHECQMNQMPSRS